MVNYLFPQIGGIAGIELLIHELRTCASYYWEGSMQLQDISNLSHCPSELRVTSYAHQQKQLTQSQVYARRCWYRTKSALGVSKYLFASFLPSWIQLNSSNIYFPQQPPLLLVATGVCFVPIYTDHGELTFTDTLAIVQTQTIRPRISTTHSSSTITFSFQFWSQSNTYTIFKVFISVNHCTISQRLLLEACNRFDFLNNLFALKVCMTVIHVNKFSFIRFEKETLQVGHDIFPTFKLWWLRLDFRSPKT